MDILGRFIDHVGPEEFPYFLQLSEQQKFVDYDAFFNVGLATRDISVPVYKRKIYYKYKERTFFKLIPESQGIPSCEDIANDEYREQINTECIRCTMLLYGDFGKIEQDVLRICALSVPVTQLSITVKGENMSIENRSGKDFNAREFQHPDGDTSLENEDTKPFNDLEATDETKIMRTCIQAISVGLQILDGLGSDSTPTPNSNCTRKHKLQYDVTTNSIKYSVIGNCPMYEKSGSFIYCPPGFGKTTLQKSIASSNLVIFDTDNMHHGVNFRETVQLILNKGLSVLSNNQELLEDPEIYKVSIVCLPSPKRIEEMFMRRFPYHWKEWLSDVERWRDCGQLFIEFDTFLLPALTRVYDLPVVPYFIGPLTTGFKLVKPKIFK